MSAEHLAYIRKETAISAVINAAISAGFVWAAFGGSRSASVWGPGGVAIDFVPQTFMVALMSVLVPTLLTRTRLRKGALHTVAQRSLHVPRNVLLRASMLALIATFAFGGMAVAVLALARFEEIDFFNLAVVKIAYGALIAIVVTPAALMVALREEPSRTS